MINLIGDNTVRTFTGLEYLKIDIANAFGLDKETWDKRLTWFELNKDNLHDLIEDAAESLLFLKGITAYEKTMQGIPSGHCMFMDATGSGLQIMAALSGCHQTARHVNLTNTGKREDVYQSVADSMNMLAHLPLSEMVTRDDIKKPLMTHFYNKMNQDSLSGNQQEAFYSVIADSFTGAQAFMEVINRRWNPDALSHTWHLPDGHVAHVKVTEMVSARIEVDELEHTTFTYQFEANQPSDVSSSLAPNVIHSIDGYIVREMVLRAHTQGFELAHVHDAFCSHPNHMNKVRQNYIDILAEIAQMDLLQSIVNEISGNDDVLEKYSNNLHEEILNSEYALS